jgi:hypothetical protein
LGKSIHSLANLHQYFVVSGDGRYVVLLHDIQRDIPEWDPHVLVSIHWVVEVENFNIEGSKTSSRRRDHGVEEKLGSSEVGRFSGDLARVFNTIPTTGESNAVFFVFVGFIFRHDV